MGGWHTSDRSAVTGLGVDGPGPAARNIATSRGGSHSGRGRPDERSESSGGVRRGQDRSIVPKRNRPRSACGILIAGESFGPGGVAHGGQPVECQGRGLAKRVRRQPDLVFAAAAGGALLFMNGVCRTRAGAAAAGSEAVALFPDDARPMFEAYVAGVVAGGPPARFQWGELGPAGVRPWITCTLSPLIGATGGAGYLCVSSDVTELKRSESRLLRSEQLMVDTQGAAHLGTWEWELTEPHASWSAELYRIYGLSPETYTPSYDNYLKMVHDDDRQRVIDATNRVFHEHVPYSHDERIFRRGAATTCRASSARPPA